MKTRIISASVVVMAGLIVLACAPQTTSKEKEQIRNKNSEEVGENGGEVAIDDGSAVTVPPGAVAIGTDVSVQKVADDPAFEVGSESASSTVEIKAVGSDGVALEQASQPMTVALSIDNGAALHLSDAGLGLVGNADDMCVLLKTAGGKQMIWRRSLLTIDEAAKKVSLQSLYFGKYKAVYCGTQEVAGFEDAGDTGATGAPPLKISMTIPENFTPAVTHGKYCFALIRGNDEDNCSKDPSASNACPKDSMPIIAASEKAPVTGGTEISMSVNSASVTDGYEYYAAVSFVDASATCPYAVGKGVDETGPGDARLFYAFQLEPSAIKSGVSGILGQGEHYPFEELTLKIGGEGTFANLTPHDEAKVCIDIDGKGGKTPIPAVFSGGKINGEVSYKVYAAAPAGKMFDRVSVRPGAACNTFDINFASADAATGKPYELASPVSPGGTVLMTPINLKINPTAATSALLGGKNGCVSIYKNGGSSQSDYDRLGRMTVSFSQTNPYKIYLPYLTGSGVPKYDFEVVALKTGGCENVNDSSQYIGTKAQSTGRELNANIEVQL